MKKIVCLLLLLLLMLVACVPVVVGRSAYAPLQASGGETPVLEVGGEWFVQKVFTAVELAIPLGARNQIFSLSRIPKIGETQTGVANWLALVDGTKLGWPAGWSVQLAKQLAARTILDSDSRSYVGNFETNIVSVSEYFRNPDPNLPPIRVVHNYASEDSLSLVFKIVPAKDAAVGEYVLPIVLLSNLDSKHQTKFELRLKIGQ